MVERFAAWIGHGDVHEVREGGFVASDDIFTYVLLDSRIWEERSPGGAPTIRRDQDVDFKTPVEFAGHHMMRFLTNGDIASKEEAEDLFQSIVYRNFSSNRPDVRHPVPKAWS